MWRSQIYGLYNSFASPPAAYARAGLVAGKDSAIARGSRKRLIRHSTAQICPHNMASPELTMLRKERREVKIHVDAHSDAPRNPCYLSRQTAIFRRIWLCFFEAFAEMRICDRFRHKQRWNQQQIVNLKSESPNWSRSGDFSKIAGEGIGNARESWRASMHSLKTAPGTIVDELSTGRSWKYPANNIRARSPVLCLREARRNGRNAFTERYIYWLTAYER